MELLRYLAQVPGAAEVIGPVARRLRMSAHLPPATRNRIGNLCARYLPIPAYVRRFSAQIGDSELVFAARPRVSMVGLAYYLGLEEFEHETLAVFSALARTARTVLDVGANAGVFSLLASRVNRQARVIAFEPHPLVAMSLARSVDFSGATNVEVLPLALGSTGGYLPLYTTVSDSLTSLDGGRVPNPVKVTVPVTTLDALVAERALADIDLVKIDVEGWELLVLEGARATLRRDRPAIVFEALPDSPAAAIEALLREVGYEIAVLGRGRPQPVAVLADALGNAPERNFLALPGERRDQILARLDG